MAPTTRNEAIVRGPAVAGLVFRTAMRIGQGKIVGDHEKIRSLIELSIEDMGYEIVMTELSNSGTGNQILRVFIDAPGGIVLDDCERVSKQISSILDVEDPIIGEYSLEVSSPGIDRPLVTIDHFSRFRGSEVKIVMCNQVMGRRRFTGILSEVGDDAVVITVDGEPYELMYCDMDKANLVARMQK